MKRVILCVICLICLTGCEVSYDLTLTEESINEVTKVYTDISLNEMYGEELLINFLNNSVNTYEPIYFNDENYDYYESGYQKNVRFYNINNYSNGNFQGLNIQNVFSFDDYYRSNAVKQCFEELNIQKSNNMYLLKTSNRCNIFDTYSLLNEIKVTIKTDLEVISSNADVVNNNLYTWLINRNNYNNKSIKITVNTVKDDLSDFTGDKDDVIDKDDNDDKKDDVKKDTKKNNELLIAIVVICFAGGLFIIIMLKKHVK